MMAGYGICMGAMTLLIGTFILVVKLWPVWLFILVVAACLKILFS